MRYNGQLCMYVQVYVVRISEWLYNSLSILCAINLQSNYRFEKPLTPRACGIWLTVTEAGRPTEIFLCQDINSNVWTPEPLSTDSKPTHCLLDYGHLMEHNSINYESLVESSPDCIWKRMKAEYCNFTRFKNV